MSNKSVLVLNDLSCYGKCSLTVALPVISAAGCEVSVLPSALLSTHTGGFIGYYFKETSLELDSIIPHLKSLDLKFDCIYIGYLGHISQIDTAEYLINNFKKDGGFVLTDPVMGDGGKLYAGFSDEYPKKMLKLVKQSDYILPNATEAAYLTGKKTFCEDTLTELKELCKNVAVTSVIKSGKTCVVAADKNNKRIKIENQTIPGIYHGAGDLFASAVIGALLNGKDFFASLSIANDFCISSINDTKNSGRDPKKGLLFEKNLYGYINSLR